MFLAYAMILEMMSAMDSGWRASTWTVWVAEDSYMFERSAISLLMRALRVASSCAPSSMGLPSA